ncbi:uncharacterized protein LOC125041368 [Penaeus chinensis]|uniref:uncharacterized protein LOC125041368 n=1 Tax=Penaeus chinensis TaxID=139456 RepID=UPI001FB5B539|nr:uncharacterized protein LOC125041368 [Penaeus chinensis]
MVLERVWVPYLFLIVTKATAWNLNNLPEPQSSACLAQEVNEIEDVKLCDPDNTLPYLHKIMTAELLTMCEDDGPEGVAVFLLLVDTVRSRDTKPNEKQRAKDPVDRLMERAARFYNLTTQKSAVFMLAVQNPLQVKIWRSDTLLDKMPEETLENATIYATQVYASYTDFPSAVNVFVTELCKSLREEEKTRRWGNATDILLILFVGFYISIVITLTVLMIRAFRTRQLDTSSEAGDLRSVPGRHLQQNPLSLELHEYGAMATYTSTGHILLSTTDVTALNTACASTEHLLDT